MILSQDRTIDLTQLGGIKFKEASHQYSNINNEIYSGVTTLLHNYYETFDTERISLNKAIKNIVIQDFGLDKFNLLKNQVYKEQLDKNKNVNTLIAHDYLYTKINAFKKNKPETYIKIIKEKNNLKTDWKERADIASSEGTVEHDKRERLVKENGYIFNDKFFEYIPEKNITNVSLKDRIVIPECLVWSHNLKLGGLADIFLFDKGTIYVQDYKTNSKIDYTTFNNKKMLGVCSRLLDTNYSHYSLQLRIYQEMALRLRPEFKKGKNTIILTSSERHNRLEDQFIDCLNVDREVINIINETKKGL